MRFGGEPEDKGITRTGQAPPGTIGSVSSTQPGDTSRSWMLCQVDDGAANAAIVVGGTAVSGEAGNVKATVYDTSGGYRQLTTQALNGDFAGWNGGGAAGPYGSISRITWVIKTGAAGDLANVRIWCALADADIKATSNPSGNHVCGFTYASDLDGSVFWRVYVSDTAVVNRITTQYQILPATRYVLTFDLPDHVFSINSVAIPVTFSGTTNLAVRMGWFLGVTTLDGNAKTINLGRVYIDRP